MKKENGKQEQELCSSDEKGKWKNLWKRRKQNSVQVMKKEEQKT
jgi:hypothetical protein